jgi:hypothetical protein
MSLRVTATAISPIWIVSAISTRLVLNEFEERKSSVAVAIEKGEQRIENLRLSCLVTLPTCGCPLAHHAINL